MRVAAVMAVLLLAGPELADSACAQSTLGSGGQIEAIDMKMADCRQSDEGVCFSSGDFDGVYHFRPTAGGEWVTMNADDFTAFVQVRLNNITRREVPQLQDWVVRYTSADGKAWLWRAGENLASGQWKLVRKPLHAGGKAFDSVLLCYSQPSLEGFPLKKPGTDGWNCSPASWIVAYPEYNHDHGYESRYGDVFHLASSHIPYKLTPNVRPEWPAEAQ